MTIAIIFLMQITITVSPKRRRVQDEGTHEVVKVILQVETGRFACSVSALVSGVGQRLDKGRFLGLTSVQGTFQGTRPWT